MKLSNVPEGNKKSETFFRDNEKGLEKPKVFQKKELIKMSKLLEPAVMIGKNGITDNTIENIKKILEKRKLIKVKMLKSFIKDKNRKEITEEIAAKTNSKVIQQVGFVVVLKRDD